MLSSEYRRRRCSFDDDSAMSKDDGMGGIRGIHTHGWRPRTSVLTCNTRPLRSKPPRLVDHAESSLSNCMVRAGSDRPILACGAGLPRPIALLGSFVHHVPVTPAIDGPTRERGWGIHASPELRDAGRSQYEHECQQQLREESGSRGSGVKGNTSTNAEGSVQTTAISSTSTPRRCIDACLQGLVGVPEVSKFEGMQERDDAECKSYVAAATTALTGEVPGPAAGGVVSDRATLRAVSAWWTGCIVPIAVLQTVHRNDNVRPPFGRDGGQNGGPQPCIASELVEAVVDTACSKVLADGAFEKQQQHRPLESKGNTQSKDQSAACTAVAGSAPPFARGPQDGGGREERWVRHLDAAENMPTRAPLAIPSHCVIAWEFVASVIEDGISRTGQVVSIDTALPHANAPRDPPVGPLLGDPLRSPVPREFVATAIEDGLSQAAQVLSAETASSLAHAHRKAVEREEQRVLCCGSSGDLPAALPLPEPLGCSITRECVAKAIEDAFSHAVQEIAVAKAPPFTAAQHNEIGEDRRALNCEGAVHLPEATLSACPSQYFIGLEFVAGVINDGILQAVPMASQDASPTVGSVATVDDSGKSPIPLPSRKKSGSTTTNEAQLNLEGSGVGHDETCRKNQQQARSRKDCGESPRGHRVPVVPILLGNPNTGDQEHMLHHLQSSSCSVSSTAEPLESNDAIPSATGPHHDGEDIAAPSIHVRLPPSCLPKYAIGATGISAEQQIISPEETACRDNETRPSPSSTKRASDGAFVRITNVPVKTKPVAVVSAGFDADGRVQKMQARAEARAKAGCLRLGLQCYQRHFTRPIPIQDDSATTAPAAILPTPGAQEVRTGGSANGVSCAGFSALSARRAELVPPRATKSAGEPRSAVAAVTIAPDNSRCGARVQLRKNRWCSPCFDGSVDKDEARSQAPCRSTSRSSHSRENGGFREILPTPSPGTVQEKSPVAGGQSQPLHLCGRPGRTIGGQEMAGRHALGNSSSCEAGGGPSETARMIYGVAVGRGTEPGNKGEQRVGIREGETRRQISGEEYPDDESYDLVSLQSSGRGFPQVSYKYKHRGKEWNPAGRTAFSSPSDIAAATTSAAVASIAGSASTAERSTTHGSLRGARGNAHANEDVRVRGRGNAIRSDSMSVFGTGHSTVGRKAVAADGCRPSESMSGGRTGLTSPKPPTRAKARSFPSSPREISYRVSSSPRDAAANRARYG